MPMTEYELSLIVEAKKGKKKSLDRLYDAFHKKLCDIIDQEIGDRSKSETILRSVFDKVKVQIKTLDNPVNFENMIIQMTINECRSYPRSNVFSNNQGGATKFETIQNDPLPNLWQPEQQNQFVQQVQQQNQFEQQVQQNQFVQQVQQQNQFEQQVQQPSQFVQQVQQPNQFEQQAQQPNQFVQQVQQPNQFVQQVQQHEPLPQQPPVSPAPEQIQPAASSIEPTVGWLVCINGAERGKDFPLKDKINVIGSAPDNDIRLTGDPAISAENHACVAYDSNGKNFMLFAGNNANNVTLNGQLNEAPQTLNHFDIITIGDVQLVFVPFCGEGFSWD